MNWKTQTHRHTDTDRQTDTHRQTDRPTDAVTQTRPFVLVAASFITNIIHKFHRVCVSVSVIVLSLSLQVYLSTFIQLSSYQSILSHSLVVYLYLYLSIYIYLSIMAPITSFATIHSRMSTYRNNQYTHDRTSAQHHPHHHQQQHHDLEASVTSIDHHIPSPLSIPFQLSLLGEGYSTHIQTGEITKWNNTKVGLFVRKERKERNIT